MDYILMRDAWMKRTQELFRQAEIDLQREAELELPGSKPHLKAVQIGDAMEVISWYHTMIYPKMMRAIQQDWRERDWEEANGFPKDSDGSAKVALISIDRSIGAWGIPRPHVGEGRTRLPETAYPVRPKRNWWARSRSSRSEPGRKTWLRNVDLSIQAAKRRPMNKLYTITPGSDDQSNEPKKRRFRSICHRK